MTGQPILVWKRDGYFHRAIGPDGDRWHIVASSAHHWSVYRNSFEQTHLWGYTLAEAKAFAEDEVRMEVDPEYRARVEARRAARRAHQAARRTS